MILNNFIRLRKNLKINPKHLKKTMFPRGREKGLVNQVLLGKTIKIEHLAEEGLQVLEDQVPGEVQLKEDL